MKKNTHNNVSETTQQILSLLKMKGDFQKSENEISVRNLLVKLAKDQGINITTSEFLNEVESFKISNGLTTREETTKWFTKNNITNEEFENFIEENILIKKIRIENKDTIKFPKRKVSNIH